MLFEIQLGTFLLCMFGLHLRLLGLGVGHLKPAHLRNNGFIAFIGTCFIAISLAMIPTCLGYSMYDQLGWVDDIEYEFLRALNF